MGEMFATHTSEEALTFRIGASYPEFQPQHWGFSGVRVNKLFIKWIPQKCSSTCLSYSTNRKSTPFSSKDHPMCLSPSSSCKNALMKPPQSQGQKGYAGCWGREHRLAQVAHSQEDNSRVRQSERNYQEVCPKGRHFLKEVSRP
jgi:hypothetical protein